MEHKSSTTSYKAPSSSSTRKLSYLATPDSLGHQHMEMVSTARSKPKTSSRSSGTIKKALPTRTIMNADSAAMSAADKKRNKLGYHRTGVACGHCRRRKIRCIPSPDTSTNRCQNCIRLKKECQFYPVDQTLQSSAKRSRSESKVDATTAGSETSVSSSSPRMHIGTTLDHFDPYRTQMTPPISHGHTPYPPTSGSSSLIGHQGHEYDYQQTLVQPAWEQQNSIGQSAHYAGDRQLDTPNRNLWPSHDQNHTNSYNSAVYSLTPAITGSVSSSNEHAYTYPAPVHNNNFQYGSQSSRNTTLAPSTDPGHHYSLYRSNTMPNPDRSGQTRGSVGSGSLMSSPMNNLPQPVHYHQTPAIPPTWPEQTSVQSNYAVPGAAQAWFDQSGILAGSRHEQDNSNQILMSQMGAKGKYRSKPG